MQGQSFNEPVWVYSCGVTLTECVNLWLASTGAKQKVIAERAGIAASKLSDLVRGNNSDPQFSTVEKLAKGFGVTIVEFLAGPSRPEKGQTGQDGQRAEGASIPGLERILAQLDEEAPADETIKGDILRAQHALASAHAALNRALRRADPKSGAA